MITRAQSPALILEFVFFWLILNMRLVYFGPEDLATLSCDPTLQVSSTCDFLIFSVVDQTANTIRRIVYDYFC